MLSVWIYELTKHFCSSSARQLNIPLNNLKHYWNSIKATETKVSVIDRIYTSTLVLDPKM